jgi:hypothetical protein
LNRRKRTGSERLPDLQKIGETVWLPSTFISAPSTSECAAAASEPRNQGWTTILPGMLAAACRLRHTDGLVEQPGQDIGAGMSRLARALAAGPARSLDQLCDNVLTSLAPRARDDIALLLARTTTQTAR